MKIKDRISSAIFPKPELNHLHTSLQYTDIVFGIIISDLYTRLRLWPVLSGDIRLHLIVGTTLILGSWVGYRRSRFRTPYEIKFFNLPLARFLIDQAMLVLYFRIVGMTELDVMKPVPQDLAAHTTELVILVFFFYLIWDGLGIWMARASKGGTPLYPMVEKEQVTKKRQPENWSGLTITGLFLFLLVFWYYLAKDVADALSVGTIFFLVLYRYLKEIRTLLICR